MKLYVILMFAYTSTHGAIAALVAPQVVIKINAAAYSSEKVEVTKGNFLAMDPNILAAATTNAKGTAILNFNLTAPVFATIQIKNQYFPVYLTPNDTLSLDLGVGTSHKRFEFKGSSSEVNTYLKKTMESRLKYDMRDDKPFLLHSGARFLQLRDSLRNELNVLFTGLGQQKRIPDTMLALLDYKNKMSVIAYEQTYAFGKDSSQIPEEITKNGLQIPYNKAGVQTALNEFSLVLSILLQSQIVIPEYARHKTMHSLSDSMPEFTTREIRKSNHSSKIKTLLQGKNITYWLAFNGPTRQINEMFAEFKKQNPDGELVSELEARFALWRSLEPGKPAPNFEGSQVDGKKRKLSDLRGKIVYIDVWATWCGPCKEEFPASRSLVEHFKDSPGIAFLFLSVDKNVEAWKKTVQAGAAPEGIHLNQESGEDPNSVWKLYHLAGIPRYILIGKNGEIIDANAPRPSSPALAKHITELINN